LKASSDGRWGRSWLSVQPRDRRGWGGPGSPPDEGSRAWPPWVRSQSGRWHRWSILMVKGGDRDRPPVPSSGINLLYPNRCKGTFRPNHPLGLRRRIPTFSPPMPQGNEKLIVLGVFNIKNFQYLLLLVRVNFNVVPDEGFLGEIFKFFGLSSNKVIAEFFPRRLGFSRVFHHFSPFKNLGLIGGPGPSAPGRRHTPLRPSVGVLNLSGLPILSQPWPIVQARILSGLSSPLSDS
jgi:hypothetical protein